MDSILIGLGFLCVLALGRLRVNKINNRIEVLENENKILKCDLLKGGEHRFEIYQGDKSIIISGVSACCTTFDTPVCRLFHKTERTYVMNSSGEVNVFYGILIDNKLK